MPSVPTPLHAVGSISSSELAAAAEAASAALDERHAHADAVDAVLDILHERVDGLHAAAFVLEHERLWIVRARGYTMLPEGRDAAEGVVGRAARSGKPQHVGDVSRDHDFVEAAHGIVAELALPLRIRRDVIGVLDVETQRALPPDAVRIMQPLADALAPAVQAIGVASGLDLSALARFFVYVGSLREPKEIAEVTARAVARALALDACYVVLDADGPMFEAAAWSPSQRDPGRLSPQAVDALRAAVEAGSVLHLLDLSSQPVPGLSDDLRGAVLLPMRANGVELGAVIGLSRAPLEYRQRQAETASLVTAHAAASIETALALSVERRSALTDELTGLLNRRGFHEMLDAEIDIRHGDRAPVSLIVLDLDEFKEINDRAGHQFGDALLREIGVVLPTIAPGDARAGRLGGDEFVVMLPDVDVDEAATLAAGVRTRLVTGLADEGFPVHVSLGVATYPFDGGSGAQLLRAADQAMYEAKVAGKNRVVRFRDLVSSRAGDQGVSAEDRRRSTRTDGVSLPDVLDAATAIAAETSVEHVLGRLAKSATFVAGGTACVASRVDGTRLVDAARHALRDIDLGAEAAYLIADFPLTQEVLELQESRSISFLDENLDRAEAFVLRELRMNCCLLVPIVVDGRTWGLVEVYDMRLRRFGDDASAAVGFLSAIAARRLEAVGVTRQESRRRLPLFRLPAAG